MPHDVSVNDLVNIPHDETSPLTHSIECPICFDNIEKIDPHLILDCCSKTIHIKCMVDWYTKHPNNKSCFICNQSNSFCKDFIYDAEPTHTIEIHQENIEGVNSHNYYTVIYTILLCVSIFILFIVLIIISE
jgi:hypothetical protein